MRRYLSAILILFMLLGLVTALPTVAAEGGTPISVATGDELMSRINGNANILLTADITVNHQIGWLGAGELTVDGGGHTITLGAGAVNLLSGGAGSMTFKNINIKTENSTHMVNNPGNYGLLLQHGCDGRLTLDNVNAVANIYIAGGNAQGGIGGLVGKTNRVDGDSFKNCSFEGSITVEGVKPGHYRDGIGGIVGCTVNADVINCNVIADISATVVAHTNNNNVRMNKYSAGGIVGDALRGIRMINCEAEGSVTLNMSEEVAYAGGLVGLCEPVMDGSSKKLDQVYISDSSSWVDVTANGGDGANAGGIIGGIKEITDVTLGKNSNMGDIKAASTVTATRNAAGGIVGAVRALGTDSRAAYVLELCINKGDVNAQMAGGILGANIDVTNMSQQQFLACVNSGDITGVTYAAGILGGNYAGAKTPYSSYWVKGCGNDEKIAAEKAGGILSVVNMGGAAAISDCVNAGTVNASVVGGGIAAQIDQTVTVKNCVNGVAVSGGSEIAQGSKFTAEGCMLSTDSNSSTRAIEAIENTIETMGKAADYTELDKLIAKVRTLNESAYTWVRWDKLMEVYDEAVEMRDFGCVYGIAKLAEQLRYRIDTLVKLPTLEEYDSAVADKENNGSNGGEKPSGSTAPKPTDTSGTTSSNSGESTSTVNTSASTHSENGGCGSLIGGAAVAVCVLSVVGIAFIKRKED